MSPLTKLAGLLFVIIAQVHLSHAAKPTVVLTATTNIAKDKATFNGTVTSNGAATTAFLIMCEDHLLHQRVLQ